MSLLQQTGSKMANTDVIADLLINAGEPDKDSSTALMVSTKAQALEPHQTHF